MLCSNVLIMFHHTHGHKMNGIDDFKYVLVKILCCNMFDFFWFINIYGNQNIRLHQGLLPFHPKWYTLKDLNPNNGLLNMLGSSLKYFSSLG
jgi:hypothetical protein